MICAKLFSQIQFLKCRESSVVLFFSENENIFFTRCCILFSEKNIIDINMGDLISIKL